MRPLLLQQVNPSLAARFALQVFGLFHYLLPNLAPSLHQYDYHGFTADHYRPGLEDLGRGVDAPINLHHRCPPTFFRARLH